MIYKNLKKYIYSPNTPLKVAIRDLYQRKIDIGFVSQKEYTLKSGVAELVKVMRDGQFRDFKNPKYLNHLIEVISKLFKPARF